MNAPRNSIPALKLYNSPPFYHQHHEYFASRHNSTAAIMTPSVAGTASTAACSRRPEIIKVCSLIGYFFIIFFVGFSSVFRKWFYASTHNATKHLQFILIWIFVLFFACRCVLFIRLCSTCNVQRAYTIYFSFYLFVVCNCVIIIVYTFIIMASVVEQNDLNWILFFLVHTYFTKHIY